jgi:transcriptional regulator with XRE-family HTH domain
MAEHRMRIAERVLQERELRGWSRDWLAREAGVVTKTVERIEAGESNPRGSTIAKIATAMGLQVSDLKPDLVAERDQLDRIEQKLDEMLSRVAALELGATLETEDPPLDKPSSPRAVKPTRKTRSRKAS